MDFTSGRDQLTPEIIYGLTDTRYLTVAGLTVLLWDHILTFELERQLIWPSRSSYVKWAFLCSRYLVPIILIINAHTLSGISSTSLSDTTPCLSCKGWFVVTFVLGVASLSIGNSLVIIKIWKLWDGKKDVISGTILVFGMTVCGLLAFIVLMLKETLDAVTYNPHQLVKACGLMEKPRWLKAVWALSSGFDAFVFAMVCLNALSRPRGSQTFLVKVLYRDGMFFFITISALGWLNLVVSTVASEASQVVLGVFCVWALSVTIVSRMIINLREAELKIEKGTYEPQDSIHVQEISHVDTLSQGTMELLPVTDKMKNENDAA